MARLGKRERAAKRVQCAANRLIIQANMIQGVKDESRQVIRDKAGSLHVVSGRGISSDHHVTLKNRSMTNGFLSTRGASLDGEGTRNEYLTGKLRAKYTSRDKSTRK